MNELFNIFNPDWWLDENNSALQITDAVVFLLLLIPVIYLLIFAIFSMGRYKNPYAQAEVQNRFLVLFTVLRNGKEAIEAIQDFFDTQLYPREKYDIAVAATQIPEDDLIVLLQMPVNIVVPDKESCTKVYAIQQVMERYSPNEYDMVLILNSDNRITPTALESLNNAYYSGCDSIQVHRVTGNLTTDIAILNAASEEINNNIFRKGHTRLGFSSALIGSAMAFDFAMFHEMAPHLQGSDLSKAMEIELLKQNVYTEYLEDVLCYSKKEEHASGYEAERSGWSGSKYNSFWYSLLHLPLTFLRGEWDFCNKVFQWLLPSRFVLLALLILMTVLITILDWTLSPKWYMLFLVNIFSFLIALPEGEIARRFRHAIWSMPTLVFTAIVSPLKRRKGTSNQEKDKNTETVSPSTTIEL